MNESRDLVGVLGSLISCVGAMYLFLVLRDAPEDPTSFVFQLGEDADSLLASLEEPEIVPEG